MSPEQKISQDQERVFRNYMEGLQLTPEDFNKKILDVGSADAGFAKWAKDHQVSLEIYSIDPQDSTKFQEREKAVRGIVQGLPFPDESFDLALSHAAIPQILWTKVDRRRKKIEEEEVEHIIQQSFQEMIRVVEKGGEVRLGRVSLEDVYPYKHIFMRSLNRVMDKLKKDERISLEVIPTDIFPLTQKERLEYERFYKKPSPESENLYLIKIKKILTLKEAP